MTTASSPDLDLDRCGSGPPPATTTISTIAVQSGNTRIVIALLQSKEWIQLKIQEMHPAMTDIGTNLKEATNLYQQHEKVLEKLQTKQSPVEELLRQADDLISTQKPRGEVYSAMAENLGLAWKDLNAQLEQRRQILEQAVAYFTKAEQFCDSLEVIRKSVSETFLPNTVESTTSMLNRIKEERKSALSHSKGLLNESQLLLERLCEVATHSMGDSRPQHMQPAARRAQTAVEQNTERLQDRWRHLEAQWNARKTQLEHCLIRCQLEAQMREIGNWLHSKGVEYLSERNLGDSLASAEILLHEHQKNENDCKEKQEYCLRLVKSAEDLQRQDHYAGEELRSSAYHLLSECADLVSNLDLRRQLLTDSVDFFTKAQTAQTKLDQIEIQLSTSDSTSLWSTAEEVANSAIQAGRHILSTTGMTDPGAQGIKRKVEELERTKKNLSEIFKTKENAASEKSAAFKKFCEKYDELIKWLNNNGVFFVQRTRDMGTTQTAAKSFLDQHEELQNSLRMKGMDMEALLRTVPNLVRSGGEEAEVVHSKSDHLKDQWALLRTTLEKRILIAQRYLAFLKLSIKVSKEMDELEGLVRSAMENPDQSKFRNIEEKQLTLRQEMLQLTNNGKNFLQDARKVDDMHLNMTQPCATVEDILSRLELRSVSLNTQWLNLQNEIAATKESLVQWDLLVKDSNRVKKCVQELEKKLFPVIPQELYRVDTILKFLVSRVTDALPLIKNVQKEIDSLLKKSENVKPKEGSQVDESKIRQGLHEINQTLQKRLTDYQILISMMITFFKNYEELEKLIDMQESQYKMGSLPNDASKMEVLVHDHEASKPTVMELFKFSNTEAQQLINKINEAEPPESAAKDRDKITSLYDSRKQAFEKAWLDYKNRLDHHNQICIFFKDMHQINKQIEDLNSQLASIRESYGESLPSALHTSEAFLQFEKTIEILQIRIYEFVSTAERMMRDQRVDPSQVRTEIDTMERKWSTFRTEVTNNRRLIDVSIEYYKTIEEAEEWLKEGSRLLMSVARKSSTCTKESDAEALQNEIQDFMSKGKPKQEERLRKISTLSQQLHGNPYHPSASLVTNKNKEMVDSFTVIRTELHTLTTNIRIAKEVKVVEQKGKEEMDAVLHAAQAEAEAAKAAAAAAVEAARAAEAAAKAIPTKPLQPPQRPPRFLRHLADAEVPEGTKFTFECEVDGDPMPQIQWFKDGILVENNPDYQTSVDKGTCKLTIEETFSEDTAKFTCKAVNPVGVAESQSHLVVKESRAPNELIPPHFLQEPLDAVVPEGEPHTLECQVFGNPLPLVSWFKDEVCIDYSTEHSITYNNGYCALKIDEAALEHQGRYTCRAVNQVGQVACSANIQVQTSAPSERPVFISPLSNVMARAGQKLRLECSVTGQPQPQVSWLHNSKSLKETRDTKLHFDGCNATLVITEAFPKDAGTYTIIARNKAGEVFSSCNVSVKGRLPMETSDSEIASDIEPAKPVVKQHLEDQTVPEGKKVRMDCIIVGQPEPEVIWYHNGKPVKESDDFQLLFEGDRCTLIIETAYLEDAGTYKCVAINSGGEASSACQLTVNTASEVIQKSQFSKKDILLTVEKYDAPKFLKLLESLAVLEGNEISLECQVAGEPEISISWFKDGVQMVNSHETQIRSDSSGISRLLIPKAKVSDRGTYSVKAQNKGGEAQSICSVSVSSAAPIKFGQSPEEVPPVFLQHVSNQTMRIGDTVRFETVVDGTPKPKVRWNFQGKPCPRNQQHEVNCDGDKKHWLIVHNIDRNHVGRYSAIAENNAGIATSSGLLSLHDDSQFQAMPVCEEYKAQSMVMTKKAVMQTSTISSVSEISDIDYEPPESTYTSFQSQQMVKKQQTFVQNQVVDKLPASLPQLESMSVMQQTLKQTSSVPQPIETAPIPQPVKQVFMPPPVQQVNNVPPKFTKPVSTAVVTEGEKLFLEAQYEGTPTPTIQWFKDDVELKNRPGLQISSSGGKTTSLFIMKSLESDSGRYSCIATNDAGKATSIADARVKPYREAPKFKKKLEAAVVRSGSRLVLEVEVTGVPIPEVKWYRNGNLLENSPDFRISSSGNCHSLVISEVFPDDSGNFMAVASNASGETRSLADLIVEEEKSPEVDGRITYQQFSSVQQTKQMFTTVSTGKPPAIEPYQNLPDVKPIEFTPIKSPSPPPMPAASVKVWTQPKPEPITPALTETQEPVPIPSPEIEVPAEVEFFPALDVVSKPHDVVPPAFPETTTFKSSAPVVAMSESFVKQSIMKFSHPNVPEQIKSEVAKVQSKPDIPPPVYQTKFEESKVQYGSTTGVPTPIYQNGFDKESKTSDSFTSFSQSTMISESKSFSSTGSIAKPFSVPKLNSVPKPPQIEPEKPSQSSVPVWQPKPMAELPNKWQKVQPPTSSAVVPKTISYSMSDGSIPSSKLPTSFSDMNMSTSDSKTTSTTSWQRIQPPVITSDFSKSISYDISHESIPSNDFTSFSENKMTATDSKSTSTTSCQTSTTPSFVTESSTTTRTSYSKEEISITKKIETITEHISETIVSSDDSSKICPKPIIKKEVKEGTKQKKEVVIEEGPVQGAEVKPPHFSKVRGAESLRKIYTDI